MRKSIFAILISLCFIIFSCTEQDTGAVKYNDEMMTQQDSIVTLIDSLDQLIIKRDTNLLVEFQNKVLSTINKKIEIVNKTSPPEGDENYKEAVLKLFNSYKTIVEDKYSKVISISLISQLELDSDTIKKFNQLIDEINQDFSINIQSFLQVQKDFAEKNKFSLVEDIKQ